MEVSFASRAAVVDVPEQERARTGDPVDVSVVGTAVALFAVTNVDDIVVLTVLLGRDPGRAGALRVVAGQYLGFAGILAVVLVCAAGVGLLPASVVAYLGLLPIALGLRAGWRAWNDRHDRRVDEGMPGTAEVGTVTVATLTFANGGDNIGVYLPVFATADTADVLTYCVVFLVMVGAWCALGAFLATRRPVARALSRWGHVLLPAVLVAVGLAILAEGGAFGL